MQGWARSAGAERQGDHSHSQFLKLAGAKLRHHIQWLCDGNQTKLVSLRGRGHGRNIGWR